MDLSLVFMTTLKPEERSSQQVYCAFRESVRKKGEYVSMETNFLRKGSPVIICENLIDHTLLQQVYPNAVVIVRNGHE